MMEFMIVKTKAHTFLLLLLFRQLLYLTRLLHVFVSKPLHVLWCKLLSVCMYLRTAVYWPYHRVVSGDDSAATVIGDNDVTATKRKPPNANAFCCIRACVVVYGDDDDDELCFLIIDRFINSLTYKDAWLKRCDYKGVTCCSLWFYFDWWLFKYVVLITYVLSPHKQHPHSFRRLSHSSHVFVVVVNYSHVFSLLSVKIVFLVLLFFVAFSRVFPTYARASIYRIIICHNHHNYHNHHNHHMLQTFRVSTWHTTQARDER